MTVCAGAAEAEHEAAHGNCAFAILGSGGWLGLHGQVVLGLEVEVDKADLYAFVWAFTIGWSYCVISSTRATLRCEWKGMMM